MCTLYHTVFLKFSEIFPRAVNKKLEAQIYMGLFLKIDSSPLKTCAALENLNDMSVFC